MIELQRKKIFLVKSLVVLLLILLSFLVFYKYNYSKIVPTFYLKGDTNIKMEVNSSYKEPGYVAVLNNNDFRKNVKVESDLNTKKLGKYHIYYTAYLKYLKIMKTLEREIEVVDTTAPELKVDSEKEITIYTNDSYDKPSASSNDNYDGDITGNIKVFSNLDSSKNGDYEITYSISDSSNNKTEEKITIHVIDKPVVEEKKKTEIEAVPVTNAYIDISISNQRLNYYENGELIISSDIVTGMNNGTPLGDYSILSKATNTTLKGANYSSFVRYWMAFIGSSYGLHDASWRSSFGGNIYRYNGSHGCVNMPTENAAALYNRVQIGTPVHIRY